MPNLFMGEKLKINLGGVDPLGLRQTNLNMMEHLLPGLNNAARSPKSFCSYKLGHGNAP